MSPRRGGFRLGADRRPPRLVLLPGIEGNARVFTGQVELAARRPTAALHLPDAPSIPALAEAVSAILPDAPVVLFGASLGGLVGWSLSLTDPRVAGLITLGTLPNPNLAPRRIAPARSLLRQLPQPVFRRLYRRRIASRMTEECVPEGVQSRLLADLPSRDTLCQRLDAITTWTPSAPPPVPTLWLRGQVDQEIAWDSTTVQAHLPSVGIEVVPGGHRAHLTHPRALNAVIEHFLRSL
ncbi:MAG: pimeloyl-ACP methyl ester carboxylesterase [Myxococcota bacterium]|jgi:pimeloyl-ACP methyl ester carboxylesterase